MARNVVVPASSNLFMIFFSSHNSLLVFSIGVDGSINFSALPLPTRYPYFYAYLGIVCICMVLALQWLLSPMAILVKTALNGVCF